MAFFKHSVPLTQVDVDVETLWLNFFHSVCLSITEDGAVMSISATEVVLFGLTVIVPLMDASLLQFPSLCSQYYKLIAFISELRPDKILELQSTLLDMILSSVHLSLTK